MPESPLANFGSAAGGAGCGVARRVGAAAKRPGGSMILPYKGKGNFLIKGGPCGVELCPALCPVRSDMEMHAVRRPVKGGPARMPQT